MKGRIQNLNAQRGYGFIRSDEDMKDIFFHFTDYYGDFLELKKGDEVAFDIGSSPKGTKAINIKLIK